MEELKKILIVDDSEIDRAVLKSILDSEFEVIEADNGYAALEIILEQKERIDAVLLDISMPLIDGFSFLRILQENSSDDVPILMITAEATKGNVEKASQYHITEFVRKPFEREDILNRVRSKLGVAPKVELTKVDIDETRRYIASLEHLYNRYLKQAGKGTGRDERRAHFMKILLSKHPAMERETESDKFQIEMLCRAAYLCNIGYMLLHNHLEGTESEKEYLNLYQQHTLLGAEIVQLNYSRNCRRFVQLCADICLHHHERYDGNGFPQGIRGNAITVYAQMCGLLERFDDLFFGYSRHNGMQFDYVLNQLRNDTGFVSEEIFSLLVESKTEIIDYYSENYI